MLIGHFIMITMAQGGTLQANSWIPGYGGVPLVPGSAEAGLVAAGKAVLNQMDPAAGAELQAAIDAGKLEIGKQTLGLDRAGAATDGNTILINFKDPIGADEVAERLRHELDHYKNGIAQYPYNGGVLTACQHVEVWGRDIAFAARLSCEYGHYMPCSRLHWMIDMMNADAVLCLSLGGTPVYQTSYPTSCCR